MNTHFVEELKLKTDQELLEIAAKPNRWNDEYIEAVKYELQGRGLYVEPKEPNLSIKHKLSLNQRRQICQSCKNHSNEITTNPDSPVICGLTRKEPEFTEAICDNYVPIPGYKRILLTKSLIALILSFLSSAFGFFLLSGDSPEGVISFHLHHFWLFTCRIVAVIGLVYFIVSFVKMLRFKYPNERD